MHEAHIMTSLMNKIDKVAKTNNAKQVTEVHVYLGALSHMSAEHFQEHFEIAAQGTNAQGASLKIDVGQDIDDPRAQDIVLKEIKVE